MPVLAETPPAPSLAGLPALWPLVERGASIKVAEQCIFQPHQMARLAVIRSGLFGEPSYAHVSACRGYHGMSLIRRFLRLGFENAAMRRGRSNRIWLLAPTGQGRRAKKKRSARAK